ncbi:MAG: ABC transporter ATP-binding protein [Deltaproteobacteria bacterium]|nr:ABC transporter ATP-binding protein [Deltaproteobacteria bacterium]
MTLLLVEDLTKLFGGLAAVSDLDLQLEPGRIVGLIGPNGAGKSTVLNMIGGTYRPTRGRITFHGREITRRPAHYRARLGIARVFQENILFKEFTALENVMVGFHLRQRLSPAEIFRFGSGRTGYQATFLAQGRTLLEQVGLADDLDTPAGSLPHGRQRILSLAIGRATGARLLLLDEPLTGLNAEEISAMSDLIRAMKTKDGLTCLVVEHNVKAIMGLCDYIYVLDFGRRIARGTPEEIARNPQVIKAYLGADEDSDWAGGLSV